MTTPREIIAEELERHCMSPSVRANGVIAALRAAGIHLMTDADLATLRVWAEDPDISLTLGGSPGACERLQEDIRRALKGGKP